MLAYSALRLPEACATHPPFSIYFERIAVKHRDQSTVSLLQKKAQESINSRLALVMKSGKYTLGYKTVLKTLRQGKGALPSCACWHPAHCALRLQCGEQSKQRLCNACLGRKTCMHRYASVALAYLQRVLQQRGMCTLHVFFDSRAAEPGSTVPPCACSEACHHCQQLPSCQEVRD